MARFVALAMKVAIVFFLFYVVARQNKKEQHSLTIVCEMLLIGFQKGVPLHTIPSWHYADLVVYYYLVLKIVFNENPLVM